jgi:hypothetical protein
MDSDKYPIYGFPQYEISVGKSLDDIEVISYHYSRAGKIRKHNIDDQYRIGYRLYNNGKTKFITVDELKRIVNVERAKAAVRVNSPMKTSVGGVVQTGDWIVGSITKIGGMFSMSSAPARHPTKDSAKAEAARLAAIDKQKKFVVMKIEAMASTQDVNWE